MKGVEGALLDLVAHGNFIKQRMYWRLVQKLLGSFRHRQTRVASHRMAARECRSDKC